MRKIIVFGIGKYFSCKRETIFEKYEVSCFLDNNVPRGEKNTYEDTDIPVINPMDLDRNLNFDIFLMSVHFIDMWKQLMQLDVSPERIHFPFFEKPYFENDDCLVIYLQKMKFENDCIECLLTDSTKVLVTNESLWRELLRRAYKRKYSLIEEIAHMAPQPISKQFGTERGTPVDRAYIEKFLNNYRDYITGEILEIEDSTYTYQFGKQIKKAMVMDVSSQRDNITFQGNLETGEGIRRNIADCFILTQTLMYIFDLKKAAKNIGNLLKKNGVALITCSGISQNSRRCMDNYGCYFNFNKDVFERMFEDEEKLRVLEVGSYGNVKTVSAHLNGLCREDLLEDDFTYNDPYYPLIVYAVVKKVE